jgi:hypothetical protein
MAVTLEPVVFVVRAGPEHNKHGDPYTDSGTLLISGDVAFLAGVTADAVWPVREQFIDELRKLGVRTLKGQRIKNGTVRDVVLDISPGDKNNGAEVC